MDAIHASLALPIAFIVSRTDILKSQQSVFNKANKFDVLLNLCSHVYEIFMSKLTTIPHGHAGPMPSEIFFLGIAHIQISRLFGFFVPPQAGQGGACKVAPGTFKGFFPGCTWLIRCQFLL